MYFVQELWESAWRISEPRMWRRTVENIGRSCSLLVWFDYLAHFYFRSICLRFMLGLWGIIFPVFITFHLGKEAFAHIGGVILFHETMYQKDDAGTPFVKLIRDYGAVVSTWQLLFFVVCEFYSEQK